MSAKFLHAFGDENRDLQRQIGCMTGIFQLFDRQSLLAGGRLNGNPHPHPHRRLTSGRILLNSASVGAQRAACSPQMPFEKTLCKSWNENQRVSLESLRTTSFSSSSSSSSSSLEYKSPQQELTSVDRIVFPDKPIKSLPKEKNSEPSVGPAQSVRQPVGRRDVDVVRDSMYKDAVRSLSIKTSTREEVKSHLKNYKDSPRPMQLSTMSANDYHSGKSPAGTDLDESLRVLVRLKEAPWNNFSEASQPARLSYDARDTSSLLPQDRPRFSCDGREASSRLRELARLSLDGRDGCLRNANLESKHNPVLTDLERSGMNLQQELQSNKRPPSIVAKLMGLEGMPNSNLVQVGADESSETQRGDQNIDMTTNTSQVSQERKQHQTKQSEKTFPNRPMSNSRLPIETAPWKQQDRARISQKTPFRLREAHIKQQQHVSVHSDIENRLKELEFQQSNRDLRALKQILDSMQAKGLLETNRNKAPAADEEKLRSTNAQSAQISHSSPALTKKNISPRTFNSPIVIMKPAKSINLSSAFAASIIPGEALPGLPQLRTRDQINKSQTSINKKKVKDLTPKVSPRVFPPHPASSTDKKCIGKNEENGSQNYRLKRMPTSSRQQQSPRENNGNLEKYPSSTSPRLQQKKLDAGRRSRSPIPSSESNKSQKQSSNRNTTDSVSPRNKLRRRPAQAQECDDDQLSETSGTRSLRSDSNISLASQVDVEVTSADKSKEMNISFVQQGSRSPSELATVPVEQPSPVPVLDVAHNQEDSTFPSEDNTANANIDDKVETSDNRKLEDKPETPLQKSRPSSEFTDRKLKNIENLLQKLTQLSSTDNKDPATDHIASLCETQSPDHRYVSEILIASGLLMKDLSSAPIQLHPSGYPINPDLFLVLEQTKSSSLFKPDNIRESRKQRKTDLDKLRRKLVFDSVNELLIQKLQLTSPSPLPEIFYRTKRISNKFPNGQRLLKELCSEIEGIKTDGGSRNDDSNLIANEAVMMQSEGWTDFSKEVPWVVLEIERSIFKELIDEVVCKEAVYGSQGKTTRSKKQLFT
ncbi:Protein LONGIFOLIA 2 [Ananas comosus]|uniref:Protein LONGIFOLIA 2 n=1 Tax=Ananas comosus TaxID=4615 RepID=A0A199V5Z6_ANACO|nr:Protein LONGIFOLIA 2 [Ananas comosus]